MVAFGAANRLHWTVSRRPTHGDGADSSLSFYEPSEVGVGASTVAIGEHGDVLSVKWTGEVGYGMVASACDVKAVGLDLSVDIRQANASEGVVLADNRASEGALARIRVATIRFVQII